MVVALLYAMQSPCNCLILSLSGSDSRSNNSWRDDNDATMEIMPHILIACDVYILCILFCLVRR